jgi:integrase
VVRRVHEKLTDRAIRAWLKDAQPGRKLFDGGGLHLFITDQLQPVWRIKYHYGGIERTYADIGTYPDVSLKDARAKLAEVKALLKQGRDPVQARRLERARAVAASEQTFAEVARDWLAHERKRKRWSAVHYEKSKRALERDVLPQLGKLPFREIAPAMVTNVMKAILARGVDDTARKIYEHVDNIGEYAQALGLRDDNPVTPARQILPSRGRPIGRPALLTFPELGDVLRRAELAHLSPAVRVAHRLCAFAPGGRVGNVIAAEWSEFRLDAEAPCWVIPRRKMKVKKDRALDHKVFLGPTIVAELHGWKAAAGGRGYLFPGAAKNKHITSEALSKAYRVTLALEGKHTPHGWRAAFSTLAKEAGFTRDAVELALDHIADNEVVRAYDRGERLVERVKLVLWWDEQLAQAQRGAEVVQLRA